MTKKAKAKAPQPEAIHVPPPPAEPGRPTKFTEEVRQRIIEAISIGASLPAAAAHAGVAQQTVRNWLKLGKDQTEGEYFEFLEGFTRARDKAELAAITAFRTGLTATSEVKMNTEEFSETRLDREGKPYTYKRTRTTKSEIKRPADWRAGLAWLERRNANRWMQKTQTEISGRNGSPIEIRAVDYRAGLDAIKPKDDE